MAPAEGKRGNLPETGGHGTEHFVTRTVGVDAMGIFLEIGLRHAKTDAEGFQKALGYRQSLTIGGVQLPML
jgi:hypothetical protein